MAEDISPLDLVSLGCVASAPLFTYMGTPGALAWCLFAAGVGLAHYRQAGAAPAPAATSNPNTV